MPALRQGETAAWEPDSIRLLVTGVSSYAINLLTARGEIASWNAGAQRLTGYAAEEVLGRSFEIFFTSEDHNSGLPRLALGTASVEGTFEVNAWRVRSDGSLFWGSVVIDAVRDGNGRLLGFVSITRDITEGRLATQVLRTSEERYKILLEGISDLAIYMLSSQGTVSSWNDGAARMHGNSADEVLGTPFSRFFSRNDQEVDIPEAALHAASLGGRFQRQGWLVRGDGSRFWADMTIEPVRNGKGGLVGFSTVTRDATERLNSTVALEQAKEQLFQAQKLEALAKLTAGVAHDFNNLLGVIQAAASLLARESLSGAGTKALDTLRRAALSGGSLTRQLLLFARQQPLKEERLDVNSLVRSFEPVLQQLVHERIDFRTELGPSPVTVLVDAAQLEAALVNLVSNAVDAMPDGGKLTLSVEGVEIEETEVGSLAAGAFAKLTLRDSGTGMPADIATRAVEPFFTTKAPGKGTGLGLAQVLGLVQRVGGELVLDTTLGNGTSVSLYLPLQDVAGNGAP